MLHGIHHVALGVSIRNHLARDPIVLDLAVAIGERTSLRCQLFWRHRHGARPCDQLAEGWLLRHRQYLYAVPVWLLMNRQTANYRDGDSNWRPHEATNKSTLRAPELPPSCVSIQPFSHCVHHVSFASSRHCAMNRSARAAARLDSGTGYGPPPLASCHGFSKIAAYNRSVSGLSVIGMLRTGPGYCWQGQP